MEASACLTDLGQDSEGYDILSLAGIGQFVHYYSSEWIKMSPKYCLPAFDYLFD